MERGMDGGINCVTMWMVSAPSQEKLILTRLALQVRALIHLTAAAHLKALLPLLQKQTLCKFESERFRKQNQRATEMPWDMNWISSLSFFSFSFHFLPFLCDFQRLVMCWEWDSKDAFWCFTLCGAVHITQGFLVEYLCAKVNSKDQ